MSDQTYPVLPEIAAHAHVTATQHRAMTEHAQTDPEGFWMEQSKRISWITPPTKAKHGSFEGDVHVKWYEDGVLNASAVCLDRHLAERPDQVAIIWEGDDPGTQREVTYRERIALPENGSLRISLVDLADPTNPVVRGVGRVRRRIRPCPDGRIARRRPCLA